MAIIPPSMTAGDQVFAAYMGPYREKNGEHRFVITIHSATSGQMIAHAEVLVATRDSGVALGDAIREVAMKEIAPRLETPDFGGHN